MSRESPMAESRCLLELAENKEKLLQSNPRIDAELIRRWVEVREKLGGGHHHKGYELQRAFDDPVRNLPRIVQARMMGWE